LILTRSYAHLQRAVPPGLEVSGMAEKKVKRMNINVEESLHDAFKAATASRGENMTDVLLQFIEQYVAKNGLAPKRKTGR
jgi:ParG protein